MHVGKLLSGICCLPLFLCAGFGGTKGMQQGRHDTEGCQRCSAGTFAPGGTTEPCIACGPDLTSQPGATSPEWCQCPAGQGFVFAPFSNGTNPDPVNVTRAAGAGEVKQLPPFFDPGFAFLGCMVCPNGTFGLGPFNLSTADNNHHHHHHDRDAAAKQLIDPTSCQSCPPGRVSLAGSTSPNNCVELLVSKHL